MEKSKARQVFFYELTSDKPYLMIGADGNRIELDEIWIEKSWFYTHTKNQFRLGNSNQIVLKFSADNHKTAAQLGESWIVSGSTKEYGQSNGNICLEIEDGIQREYYLKSYYSSESFSFKKAVVVDSVSVSLKSF